MPFDDDDAPLFAGPSSAVRDADGDGDGDGDGATAEEAMEDDMPDYKLFAAMFDKKGVSSKSIRKGEKDFEQHGTMAQGSTLETSRRALEDVLSYTRIHKPDSWTRGWLLPNFWEEEEHHRTQSSTRPASGGDDVRLCDRVVVVEHEKGNWMRDIGRVVSGDKEQLGVGRLWLLPEEALHLVERGTLDLWWPSMEFEELIPRGGGAAAGRPGFGPDDYEAGTPLSLEAAYSLLVGFEGERGKTTLPKYQVYAHLKRAGFNILRAPPYTPPPPPEEGPEKEEASSAQSLWRWLFSYIGWGEKQQPLKCERPFGPLVAPGLYRAYRPIYQQLALLPRHKPLTTGLGRGRQDAPAPEPQDPFKVHYHVWKPAAGGFSKKSPPPPDFRIAVADTSESSVPTLEQVTALLDSTPYDPPPEAWQGPGRLYQRLKHGHRNVLVAVVDRGLVNFMRFGEGAFGEEELFARFDARGGGRGGKKGGRGRGRGGRGRGRGGRGG